MVAVGVVLTAEQFDSGRDLGAEKIRFGRGQIDPARILAVGEGSLDVLARTVEIALGDLDLDERAVGGRVAAGNVEIAGCLVNRLDIEDDMVRCGAGLARYFHGFEVVQILQAPFGPVDQRFVVGIAFRDIELAPDHVIAGARVAMNLDPFDIGAGPLFDHEGDVDTLRGGIAREARGRLGKGITELCHFDGQKLGGLVQGVAVEHRAWMGRWKSAKLVAIQARNVADDADFPEEIERTFVDCEAECKTLRCWIVLGLCG